MKSTVLDGNATALGFSLWTRRKGPLMGEVSSERSAANATLAPFVIHTIRLVTYLSPGRGLREQFVDRMGE